MIRKSQKTTLQDHMKLTWWEHEWGRYLVIYHEARFLLNSYHSQMLTSYSSDWKKNKKQKQKQKQQKQKQKPQKKNKTKPNNITQTHKYPGLLGL